MRIVETQRTLLRHLELTDLPALAALYADPEIRRFFPDGTRTYAETKEELEFFLNGHPRRPELGLWAVIDKQSKRFLGRCGLLPWQIDGTTEIELAFLIDRSQWSQGLATEVSMGILDYARDRLGLERLICLIMPGNQASVRVATKVGMQFERDYTDEYGYCHIYSRSLTARGVA